MRRLSISLALALVLCGGSVWAQSDPASGALAVRAGAVWPAQGLDGAGLRAAAEGRWHVGGPFWLGAEIGVDRVALTSLSETVEIPGGASEISLRFARWSVPLLAGPGLQAHTRWGWLGLQLSGGMAWFLDSESIRYSGDPGALSGQQTWWAPLVQGRAEVGLPLEVGTLVLSGGWRALPWSRGPERARRVRSDGAFSEVGWCVVF